MILVGQYDSPYVRRVAVSLRVLGFDYQQDTRSVFADFGAMRQINPLGRIPSLVAPDGEVLIDSAAILDWLDQWSAPRGRWSPLAGRSGGAPSPDCARHRRHRQGWSRCLRAHHPAIGIPVARVDRSLHDPGDGRDRRIGRRALACRGLPRSGADHDRLHDTLCADGRPRAPAVGPLSCPRRLGGPLRGAAGVPGDLSRRLRSPTRRLRARSTLTPCTRVSCDRHDRTAQAGRTQSSIGPSWSIRVRMVRARRWRYLVGRAGDQLRGLGSTAASSAASRFPSPPADLPK